MYENNNNNNGNNSLLHCTYFERTKISAHHGQVVQLLCPLLLLLVIPDGIAGRTECLVTGRCTLHVSFLCVFLIYITIETRVYRQLKNGQDTGVSLQLVIQNYSKLLSGF